MQLIYNNLDGWMDGRMDKKNCLILMTYVQITIIYRPNVVSVYNSE